MTIFGPDLEALELADVQSYLDDADDEPLVWEAKGTKLDKGEIRQQVCGFANSHEGGYLILGADREGDRWVCNGVEFPADEPTTWLTDIVGDDFRGVRPRPDFAYSRVLRAPKGHVVVVRVRATPTPPCLANGTVYERIPGKTVPIRDPQRLAALYSQGEQARRRARDVADGAADMMFDGNLRDEAVQLAAARDDETSFDCPRFSLAVASTGYPPDLSRRVFQHSLVEELWYELKQSEPGQPEQFGPQADPVSWFQDGLVWRAAQRNTHVDWVSLVRASWQGAVVVSRIYEPTDLYPDRFVERAGKGWRLADRIMRRRLGGYGDVYLTLVVGGRKLVGPRAVDKVTMRRGPLAPGVHPDEVASLGRELMRAVGNPEAEPEFRAEGPQSAD